MSLDNEVTYELMLATTEAFANAVQHGAPCDERGIFVRIETCARGVEVEVCDCGGCFHQNGAITPKPNGEGGRGISIITSLMDSLEVVPDGGSTRVRFEKWLATG